MKVENKNIRNILLFGRTGSGKSTLANILSNTSKFKESEGSVSETREVQSEDFTIGGIYYRVTDTVGIGDTNLPIDEVLYKLARTCVSIENGLNQILFVTGGRFTEEEIFAYNLLKSVIFDSEVVNYTTIVRTRFPSFKKSEKCEENTKNLTKERDEIVKVVESCKKVIYVNNPNEEEDPEQEARKVSRTVLLTHLGTCQGNYKPENLDQVNDRIRDKIAEMAETESKMKETESKMKELEEQIKKLSEENSKNQKKVEELENLSKKVEELENNLENMKNIIDENRYSIIQSIKEKFEKVGDYIKKSRCNIM